MTVIMTIFGMFVFVISLFTKGFTPAFKRLLAFAGTGVLIDLIILSIAYFVTIH